MQESIGPKGWNPMGTTDDNIDKSIPLASFTEFLSPPDYTSFPKLEIQAPLEFVGVASQSVFMKLILGFGLSF